MVYYIWCVIIADFHKFLVLIPFYYFFNPFFIIACLIIGWILLGINLSWALFEWLVEICDNMNSFWSSLLWIVIVLKIWLIYISLVTKPCLLFISYRLWVINNIISLVSIDLHTNLCCLFLETVMWKNLIILLISFKFIKPVYQDF